MRTPIESLKVEGWESKDLGRGRNFRHKDYGSFMVTDWWPGKSIRILGTPRVPEGSKKQAGVQKGFEEMMVAVGLPKPLHASHSKHEPQCREALYAFENGAWREVDDEENLRDASGGEMLDAMLAADREDGQPSVEDIIAGLKS